MMTDGKYKIIPLEHMENGWDTLVKIDQKQFRSKEQVEFMTKIYDIAEKNTPEGYSLFNISFAPVMLFAIYRKLEE